MKATLVFFREAFRKRLLLLAKYPLNTFGRLVTMYLLFALIFFGGRQAAPTTLSDSLAGVVAGYFLWITSVSAYQGASTEFTKEAQWGTLEQLHMSPLGMGRVLWITAVVRLLVSVALGGVVLVLMMLTTGEFLSLNLPSVVALSTLAFLPVLGIGFLFGGLTLLYKRIERIVALFQFVLIGFVTVPLDVHPLAALLPLTKEREMLARALEDGLHIWEFAPASLGVLVAKAVAFLVVGHVCFHLILRRARTRGVLGHY
jgi:ABC-2 type transport system permease protein